MSKFYVTVTSGLRGHFAVMIVKDKDGYEEPYISSSFSGTREEAEQDAKDWAIADGIPYK